jgi:hypothetical protein
MASRKGHRKLLENDLEKYLSELQRVVNVLSDGDFLYRIRKYATAYRMVLTHYARFKVGDRVCLARTPNLANAPGWRGCERFLIRGARATVVSSDIAVDSGEMRYAIAFDEESWCDLDGNVHLIADRHPFSFSEGMLESLGDDRLTVPKSE